jgi:hypothetical protein
MAQIGEVCWGGKWRIRARWGEYWVRRPDSSPVNMLLVIGQISRERIEEVWVRWLLGWGLGGVDREMRVRVLSLEQART